MTLLKFYGLHDEVAELERSKAEQASNTNSGQMYSFTHIKGQHVVGAAGIYIYMYISI